MANDCEFLSCGCLSFCGIGRLRESGRDGSLGRKRKRKCSGSWQAANCCSFLIVDAPPFKGPFNMQAPGFRHMQGLFPYPMGRFGPLSVRIDMVGLISDGVGRLGESSVDKVSADPRGGGVIMTVPCLFFSAAVTFLCTGDALIPRCLPV